MFFIKDCLVDIFRTLNLSNNRSLRLKKNVKLRFAKLQLLGSNLLLHFYVLSPEFSKERLNIRWNPRKPKVSTGFNKPSVTLNTIKHVQDVTSLDHLDTSWKISAKLWWPTITYRLTEIYIRSFSFGFHYIQGCLFLLFIDACLTDDEPLWEPIEWSLVQTWILIIFMFGWIAENLVVSRYGSYTGRDKRVWMSWYKTFWLIELYYLINFAVAAMAVITPFYFEVNYTLSFVYTWWHWYSRVFFFKFISLFTIVLYLSYLLQFSVRWLHWKKSLTIVILINIFLSYLIYTHFIMSFFGYFTSPVWYQRTRTNDYIQLSHGPSRWGWGAAKKDHFTYHNTKTVFWFKNDGPFASAFLLFHLYLFLSLFFVYIYWITLFRRIYSMKEVPLTYTTYCVSTLKQFFYAFLMIYGFVFISFITQYWRLPIEFFWGINVTSWWGNFASIIFNYGDLLYSLIF